MKYDFIAIGGAVEDITFKTDEGVLIDNKEDVLRQKLVGFEYGAKIRINDVYRFPGGGANNAAVAMAKMGFSVVMLGAVGEDESGDRLIKNLAANKIDTRLVKRVAGVETGFSFIVITQNNEHVAFVYRGANDKLFADQAAVSMFPDTEWLYVTSLSGQWEKVLDQVFSAKEPLVAWNPGNVQLAAGVDRLRKYLQKTTVFMVNKDEAIELTISSGKYKNEDENYLNQTSNLLTALKGFGPKTVLITDGERGADFYDGDNFYHQDSLRVPPEKIADTTGVGDAFCSTFIAGLELYEGDIKQALKLAMKNSAATLKEAGAQNGLLSIKR